MARLEITSLAFMLVWVPLPVCVDEGGGLFQHAEGPDDRARHRVRTDREVMERTGRLGPPVAVGGDLDLPHPVALDSTGAHGSSSCAERPGTPASMGRPGPGVQARRTVGSVAR